MNLLTLETVAPTYTFDGQLPSRTFTAHPKLDSQTGNMVAFGYESEGHGSDIATMFEFTPQGKLAWNAKVQVPYVGMLHDFAVTENYIVFYVIPMTINQAQMDAGGIHWSWDNSKPTYFGFVRRGGDGKDVRWIQGPTRSATHVMGAFDDDNMLIVDVEMSMSNPFPFMPMQDGSRWDPVAGSSHITRLTVDLSKRRPSAYGIEQMYPHVGALPRQDDRYNTAHLPLRLLGLPGSQRGAGRGRRVLCAFRPPEPHVDVVQRRHRDIARRVLLRAEDRDRARGRRLSDGPCHAQYRRRPLGSRDSRRRATRGRAGCDGSPADACPGQVHGWWVPEWQMPTA